MKKQLLIWSILLTSVVGACGYEAANDEYGQQPPPNGGSNPGGGGGNAGGGGNNGGGNPGGGGNTPLTGDALVKAECGRCHQPGGQKPNPQIRTVAEYKRAGGPGEVRTGEMPPDKKLDDATKAALLAL